MLEGKNGVIGKWLQLFKSGSNFFKSGDNFLGASETPVITPRNICSGYLLESPCRGDSNKYQQHLFLGVLNTIFLNISNYLPHLELRNRSIQIVIVMNFDVISNGVKRFDCTLCSSNL